MNKLITTLIFAAAWVAPLCARADEYADFDPTKATPTVNAPLFVVLAYSGIWLVAVGFTFALWKRQRRIDAELDDARRRLDDLRGDTEA